ncbi:hypothetical protein LINPERHAP1_LOCUS22608 [Linum perenne]
MGLFSNPIPERQWVAFFVPSWDAW